MKYSPYNGVVPLKDRIVLTIDDVVALSTFGRATVYRAMNAGKLIAHKEGVRTLILREDFDAWLRGLPKRPTRSAAAPVPHAN